MVLQKTDGDENDNGDDDDDSDDVVDVVDGDDGDGDDVDLTGPKRQGPTEHPGPTVESLSPSKFPSPSPLTSLL